MAKFGFAEADNYGQENSGSFFSLKDDGDTANVRFLYGTIEDVQGDVVHEVHTDGDPTNIKSKKYINCLRSYNEPLDVCPFCAAGYKQQPKLFIKLFNEDTQEVQIWERGKAYFQRLSGLASHFNPLYNEVVSVERHGKKGDLQTRYDMIPIESSEFDMSDIEVPDALGTIVMDLSADECNTFLQTGTLPGDGADVSTQRSNAQATRRTPSTPPNGRRAF